MAVGTNVKFLNEEKSQLRMECLYNDKYKMTGLLTVCVSVCVSLFPCVDKISLNSIVKTFW